MGELMHTPGPWNLKHGNKIQFDYLIVSSTAGLIASFNHLGKISKVESDANAKLISAAPDLLAALIVAEKLCGSLTSDQCSDSIHIQIKDAIAKATRDKK